MRFSFASQLGTVFLMVGLGGCAESRTRSDDADGSVAATDGSMRRDAGPVRDASAIIDAVVPGRDLGRGWREACAGACGHAVGCGAVELGTIAECTSECGNAEADFPTSECRDVGFAALSCLESLACDDIRGLSPEETLCAPLFARLSRTCGGG